MHQILVDLLEQFGIDIGWEELDNTESLDEYIVFSIYDDKDSNITTEGNLTETYYITVNYWYKNLDNINKYRKIKSLLKENGFIYGFCRMGCKHGKERNNDPSGRFGL